MTTTLRDALKEAATWGDRLTLTGTMLFATKEGDPRGMGFPLVVPDLSTPLEVTTDRLRAVVQSLGEDLTISVQTKRSDTRVVLTSPDRGEVALPARRVTSVAPVPTSAATWSSLTAESVGILRRLATLAPKVDGVSGTQYSLTGVRVTPWYVAVTDGRVGVCRWQGIAVTDPVTIPASFIRKLPDAELSCCVEDTLCWFRGEDGLTWWTSLLAGEWPDTLVHDLIPNRRDTPGVTFPVPEHFADVTKVAASAWSDRTHPLKVTISGKSLVISLDGDTRVHRRWQGVPDGFVVMGVDPVALAEVLAVLPADNLTLSAVDASTALYLHASGIPDVEAVVMPMYLPRVSS
jgi:hypothetical protein